MTKPADELARLVTELFPICRSITGDGVRATLRVLQHRIPLEVHEIPSGTPVLDWVVPSEWNITDAYVSTPSGERVIDFRTSNLHVVSYSIPVHARMALAELRPHLHTLPQQPDAVPYRTSYYNESWGFCLSQRLLDSLPDGEYDVHIDSTLRPGSLTYGELAVPGETEEREIIISAHVCHPSLADDNVSGIAVATLLARRLLDGRRPRHTVRFLFAPGTIGTIAWLATNEQRRTRIVHGLTLTCLGDDHPFTYKRTLAGDAIIDRAAARVLAGVGDHRVVDFTPYGYDERQYNSPGFRLPVGSLMRGRHGEFPEYHTSLDNLDFVSGARMAEALDVVAGIVDVVDRNRTMRNLAPFGEPQLGARGLYGALGGTSIPDAQLAMLWLLNLSDASHTLLAIAERSGLDFDTVAATAELLEQHGLLEEV